MPVLPHHLRHRRGHPEPPGALLQADGAGRDTGHRNRRRDCLLPAGFEAEREEVVAQSIQSSTLSFRTAGEESLFLMMAYRKCDIASTRRGPLAARM